MSGQTKKKSTSGKKTQTKSGTKSQRSAPEPIKEGIYQEVLLWASLAVSIVLFVSNFGIGGKAGSALSGVLFGLFGLLAYVFPILLFVGTVFLLSNRHNRIAIIKVVAAVLFVCFLCLFLELIGGESIEYSPTAAYRYGAREKVGGGFFGGLLAWLICPNFGRICAYVIDFIVLIITMVIVTERSAWIHVKHGGQKVYESAREGNEKIKSIQQQHAIEKKARRMENKVSGVSDNTLLIQDIPVSAASEDVVEITPDTFAPLSEKRKKAGLPNGSVLSAIQTSDLINDDSKELGGYAVTGKQSVSLKPIEEELAEKEPVEKEPIDEEPAEEIPVFSPQLQELFAGVEEPMAAEYEEEQVAEYEEPIAEYEEEQVAEYEEPIAEYKKEPVVQVKETKAQAVDEIAEEITEREEKLAANYVFPPVELLRAGDPSKQGDSKQHLQKTALKLQQTLKNFGVNVTILNVSCGPTVTRYEIQPEMGVKVSKIVNLTDDIKLNLAAADIRMEAPIPGKAAIGIEVPNKETMPVMFRDLVESKEFKEHSSNIAFAAGRDIGGQVIMADIAKMPHLLIAGATGSGKSVCINTIIMSLLYRADPEDVKLILIDPKVVELSVYNGIPHLFIPVVTDPKKAAGALNWAVAEMTDRYQKFAACGVRDLKGYNAKIDSIADIEDADKPKKLPQIVIIVDELADLMMVAPGDVEDAICRLAQLARACGIHLILATQRPSVNVITGLIKANMPSRMAFAVTSGVDSRTILDMVGAEKLLGKGDCLYYPQGMNKPLRLQGAFVSDSEVSAVVDFIKESFGQADYDASIEEKMSKISESTAALTAGGAIETQTSGRDAYFVDAARLLMDKDKASIGMLQRYFRIGFNRAARIMDQLEEAGVVGPEEGTKPRQILMNPETFDSLLEDGTF